MSEFFDSIKQGLTEAIAYSAGDSTQAIVHKVSTVKKPSAKSVITKPTAKLTVVVGKATLNRRQKHTVS